MTKTTAPRKTKLTDVQRHQILGAFLPRFNNGHLKRRGLSAVAAEEGIHPSTISRLWARARTAAESTGHFESPSRRSRSGRPGCDHTPTLERLRAVPVEARSTVRSAAVACGMAPTTLFDQLRQGNLRTHTSVVKPVSTETNK
ncbi:hypothetical protein PF004_g14199 [Phytophthora fragariae]|uniref:DUF7769 domain-containing protein n=1 Tax=Phytophthora fragariae TaxID=53985 RepID=A0A6G0NPW7_9STRA|nr:hypothetical protein PF004_g14199 [Phytophthora fragariae]